MVLHFKIHNRLVTLLTIEAPDPLSIRIFTLVVFSSVGIATRYGLDDPRIESLWGRDFTHPSRPALGSTQPPVQWVPGLSRG